MERELFPCLWLVLVRIPAKSVAAYMATPQHKRKKVTTALVQVVRKPGHSLFVARSYNVTVDVKPDANTVRIAWFHSSGQHKRPRTTEVVLSKPFVWMENGTTTVMACAFADDAAARAWAKRRRTSVLPESIIGKAA